MGILGLILFIGSMSGNVYAESKILLIHSYPPNIWTDRLEAGIKEGVVKNNYVLETYHYHSLFWSKAAPADREKELAFIIEKAKDSSYVGYIVADDEAATDLGPAIQKLERPTVFTGLNRLKTDSSLSSYCTAKSSVLLEEYPYDQAIQTVLKIAPKATQYGIITSKAGTASTLSSGLQEFTQKLYPKLKLTKNLHSDSWEEWKTSLKSFDREVDFFWIFVPFGVKDRMNEEISPDRIGSWVVQNLKSPQIGAQILSKSIDVAVGLDAKDLGTESIELFLEQVKHPVSCPISSKSYKITLKGKGKKK